MKYNYHLFIILILIMLFKGNIINLVNNVGFLLFRYNNSLEIKVLKEEVNRLENEYNSLLDFKNNIKINHQYTITNLYYNNYSYDKLIINGSNYQLNNEVVNDKGLVGIISKIYSNYSEVTYLYNTKIPVIINDYKGVINDKDENNNIIIKDLPNYANININDEVYSIHHNYIGKVIKIKKEEIQMTLIVQIIELKHLNYLAVISEDI